MTLLRNLARWRLRTVLTITGIMIGIWAIVVFGSMANWMWPRTPVAPGWNAWASIP